MVPLDYGRRRHGRHARFWSLGSGRAIVRGIQAHARARGRDGPAAPLAELRPAHRRTISMKSEAARGNNPLVQLGELGQSVWYDYITRDLLVSGELDRLIREDGLRGMTSNPTIFEKAIAGSTLYDEDIRRLSEHGSAASIFESIAVADVQAACDAFAPLYHSSGKRDGFVSLEVSPRLAQDTEGTFQEARRLWQAVARPNAMIKIPGTRAGLSAISQAIAAGINVNVTLLFSVERYAEVIEAFLQGLES